MMLRLLIYCLLNCLLSAAVYGQSALELSNRESVAGGDVRFTYTGPLSKTLFPEFKIYFFGGGPLKWTTVRGNRDEGRLKGDFRLPAGVLAFCIKPDKYKDVREAFTFSIFNNHEPVAGALAGMAQFHYNLRRYTGLKDSVRAIELFREEFKRHPELKAKYLLEYYRNGTYGVGSIGKEMQSAWADSLQAGQDEQFLFQLYSIVIEDRTVDGSLKSRLREDMLRLYPKGELALNEDPNQARSDDLSGLKMLETQYPLLVPLGKLDRFYNYAVRKSFQTGKYAEGDQYLKKVRNPETAEMLYGLASYQLLNNGVHLDRAIAYTERSIGLIDSLPMSETNATEQEWHLEQLYKKRGYLNRRAEILYKQGKLKEAIAAAALGDEILGWDTRPKERYLKYLIEDGRYKEAVKSASGYILAQYGSDQIEAYLKNAYLLQGSSAAAYRVYHEGLERQKNIIYKLPGQEMTDVKAIDFSLKDTSGKTMSLKDYRGKNVVLYFFSPSTNGVPEIETYLGKKMNALKTEGKIELLGIDENIVLSADLARCTEFRDSIVNAFFKKAGTSFPVLLDTYTYIPGISFWDRYLDVSSDYGADRAGEFFLIDKKGMVRYKSSNTAFTTLERFQVEFSAALKLME